jgi:uncharacterized protein (DUF58 family)
MSLKRNAMLLIVASGLLAILSYWSGDPALQGSWRFAGALLLVGLAYESWSVTRSAAAVELDAPGAFYLGREAPVRFLCRHRASRAVELQIAPSAPPSFDGELAPGSLRIAADSVAALERTVSATRLGAFPWPPARFRIAGPLGLAWWPKSASIPREARVLPDLFRQESEARAMAAAGARLGLKVGAGTEVMRLREYRPGDAPRVIDWKATARADRLVSRDFAEDHRLQIVIAVDAGRTSGLRAGTLDRFGHYVNVAARLAQRAALGDDAVGLVVYADRPLAVLPPARGMEGAVRLRAALAAARVTRTESNPLHAAMRVRSLVHRRSLIVMLTDVDDTNAASQLVQAVRLLLPMHLPFVAGLSSAAAEAMAAAPARHWLDPYRALAAQEYSVGLTRKVRALRAWGAPALVAKPEQLELAVISAYEEFRRRRRA